jgi:GTP-binding protein EngB required for normal cell division
MTDQAPERSPLTKQMRASITATRGLAAAHNRPDLAERLADSQKRLDDPALYVLVVGEFKQGKSSLVNALVGSEVCPVDDDIATAVPTVLRNGPEPAAVVLLHSADPHDPEVATAEPDREPVALESVADFVTETARPPADRRVHSVELTLPAPVLESGLVLVDTPGVGGLGSIHSTVTMRALPMAEALVFVSDASQEFTEPEIEFMESARSMCPNIVVLLTKIDFYPAWRKVMSLNEAHLERLGINAEILPVSSTLHTVAQEAGDDDLAAESGFPAMQEHLMTQIVGQAEALTAAKLASDLTGVLDQLQSAMLTGLQALRNPATAQEKQGEFREAKENAEELKSRAAKWQQTLQDGYADLNADLDHDLRARFRKINEQVDEVLEDIDPGTAWDEFEPWLYQRVAEDVVNNYKLLQLRGRELAASVAEHFEVERAELDLIDLEVVDPTQGLDRATVRAQFEAEEEGKLDSGTAVIRGGMMGALPISMGSGMVFNALSLSAAATALPLLVVVAPIMVGFGVKSRRDKKGQDLKQRRNQARTSQRKYMDEAQFVANKDAREGARLTQRQIRDFFTTRAAEQGRAVDENLKALNKALQTDQKSVKQQTTKLETDVNALKKVRNQVRQMSPQAGR